MSQQARREHEQLMTEYTALWNGDFEHLGVVAESVTVHHPTAPDGEVHGRESLEAFIREFHDGFPDFHVAIDDWQASGDTIMKQYTVSGTHEGEFMGFPPTGEALEVTGMARIEVEDGQVLEDRLYHNELEGLEQLGLLEL